MAMASSPCAHHAISSLLSIIRRPISALLSKIRRPIFSLFIYVLGIVAFTLAVHILGPLANVNVVHRRPMGLETTWDLPFAELHFTCKVSDPASWGYGACSDLIDCYLDKLPELHKADMAIGSTLAALLPTVMVLISSEAKDLVPQALVSPHRALATALYTVGAPAAMLRLLKPIQRGRHTDEQHPRSHERTWAVPMACIAKREWHVHTAVKLAADASVLALSATMLYETWRVNVSTVICWKCENPLLLIIWPLSCLFWLAFSVLLLLAMAEEVDFQNARLGERASWLRVFLLPYAIGRASMVDQDYCIHITARMPREGRVSLIANWRMYDFITGVTAAAVYIYATFILSSSMFLGAVSAYRFTGIISALHVGVRVIGGII